MNEVTLTLSSESLDAIQDTLEQLFDGLRSGVHLEHLLITTDLKCPVCNYTDLIEGEYNDEGDLMYECSICNSKFFYYENELDYLEGS